MMMNGVMKMMNYIKLERMNNKIQQQQQQKLTNGNANRLGEVLYKSIYIVI